MWCFILGHLMWHASYLQHIQCDFDVIHCCAGSYVLFWISFLIFVLFLPEFYILSCEPLPPFLIPKHRRHMVSSLLDLAHKFISLVVPYCKVRCYPFIHKDYFCVFCHCKLSGHIVGAWTVGRMEQLQVNMWRCEGTFCFHITLLLFICIFY